jgi:hypothetical protein
LLPPFFEPPFFFAAMFSILPFPFFMDMRSYLKKTADDECIEILKIEVKKKMDGILDGSSSGGT